VLDPQMIAHRYLPFNSIVDHHAALNYTNSVLSDVLSIL